ncbi:unnamed protein product [Durusdinium trenchii]|uniref:Uncharacterized protein n=1 Tax=Durusdinium trenchii TaxID=1381693 RepID=A0ABP0P108_9DINO
MVRTYERRLVQSELNSFHDNSTQLENKSEVIGNPWNQKHVWTGLYVCQVRCNISFSIRDLAETMLKSSMKALSQLKKVESHEKIFGCPLFSANRTQRVVTVIARG